jgi:hypothetical protein
VCGSNSLGSGGQVHMSADVTKLQALNIVVRLFQNCMQ